MEGRDIPGFDPNSLAHLRALKHLNTLDDAVSPGTKAAIAAQWPSWVALHEALDVQLLSVQTANRAARRRRRNK